MIDKAANPLALYQQATETGESPLPRRRNKIDNPAPANAAPTPYKTASVIFPENGSVIFAEVEYDYNSRLGYFFSTTKTLSDEFYLRPRRTDRVGRETS